MALGVGGNMWNTDTNLWTESRGDRWRRTVPILSPSLPRIYSCEFLSDSGLYIISCELVRHFTASLEKEEVVNKIIIRLKSCATPRGWDVLLNAIRGGRRGDLCCSVVFSSVKGWERGLPHM